MADNIDPFQDTFVRMIGARAIVSASSLGVFDAVAAGANTPERVAGELGLDPVGVEVLMNALVSQGYLHMGGDGTISLAPASARLLRRDSPTSIAAFVGHLNEAHWEALARLDDVLRGDTKRRWHASPEHALWESYLRGLFQISREDQDANAEVVTVPSPRRLVDLGGGHGGFSMAMCRRFPRLSATVVDLPSSVEAGRKIVQEEGYSDRIRFVAGDVLEVDMGAGVDVISCFNLVHHLTPENNALLFRRSRAVLAPGGCFVLGDTERPAPGAKIHGLGALSGVLFYAMSGTRTYTVRELQGWLTEAGFQAIRFVRNERAPWRVLLVASATTA